MERRPGFPFAFDCKRSGNCCAIPGGIVRVTDAEAASIAALLGLDIAAFRSRYVQPDGVTLKEGLGHRCVFLQDGATAGCAVYAARPARCREWPFWPELLHDAGLLQLVRSTCHGIVSDEGDGATARGSRAGQ